MGIAVVQPRHALRWTQLQQITHSYTKREEKIRIFLEMWYPKSIPCPFLAIIRSQVLLPMLFFILTNINNFWDWNLTASVLSRTNLLIQTIFFYLINVWRTFNLACFEVCSLSHSFVHIRKHVLYYVRCFISHFETSGLGCCYFVTHSEQHYQLY